MSGFLRRLFKRGSRKRPNADTRQEPVLEWETQDFIPRAAEEAPVVDPWDADAPEPEQVEDRAETSAREPGAEPRASSAQAPTLERSARLEPASPSALLTRQSDSNEDAAGRSEISPEPESSADEQAAADTETETSDPSVSDGDRSAAEEFVDPWDAGEIDTPDIYDVDAPASEIPAIEGVSLGDSEMDQAGLPALREPSDDATPERYGDNSSDASDETTGVDAGTAEPAPIPLYAQSEDAPSKRIDPIDADTLDDDVWEELSAAEAGTQEDFVEDEPAMEAGASALEADEDDDTASETGSFGSDAFEFDVVDPVAADEDVDIETDIGTTAQADPWAEDLGAAFEPFDFDPDAYQSPWEDLDGAELEDITPQDKAARIAAEIDVVTSTARREIARELTELFQRLPHSATFRALAAAADNGLTPELLRDMIALREVWAQRPDFWLRRSFKTGEVYKNHAGAGAMTWALARRVCLVRDAYPPEDMVDPDWVAEWLLLERGEPGYLDFAHFVDLKVANVVDERVRLGLHLVYADLNNGHVADRWDWPLAHRITDDCYPVYDRLARDRAEALQAMQQAKYPDRRELHPIDLEPDFSY